MDGSLPMQRPLPMRSIPGAASWPMIHRTASSCGLGLPRERLVWLWRAGSAAFPWAGLALQLASCLPFPSLYLGAADGAGCVCRPSARALGSCRLHDSNCPELIMLLPVRDPLPEPRTFLAVLQ